MTIPPRIRTMRTRPLRTRSRRARLALEALEGRVCLSTITVLTTGDTTGSLTSTGPNTYTAPTVRAAIDGANSMAGDDSIDFDPTAFSTAQTITLGGTELLLSDTSGATTITGPASGVTISANLHSRVFTVNTGVTASFSGLTITKGVSTLGACVFNSGTTTMTDCVISGGRSVNVGGGGVANSGTLMLTDCTISGNSTTSSSGSGLKIARGGGLYNTGTATLTGCTVSGNSAQSMGGGLFNYGSGRLTLTGCTVSGNQSTNGGGGGLTNTGLVPGTTDAIPATASLNNCTISGNSALGSGGGLYTYVSGATYGLVTANKLFVMGGASVQTTLTNCTVSGNTGQRGGGISAFSTSLNLINCTISGNTSRSGGPGDLDSSGFTPYGTETVTGDYYGHTGPGFPYSKPITYADHHEGQTLLINTIVSSPISSRVKNIISPVNHSRSANISFTLSFFINANTTLVNSVQRFGTAELAPLGYYGGQTQTMFLLPGSAGIDSGTAAWSENDGPSNYRGVTPVIPATDQRGLARVGAPDIGAVEVQPALVVNTTSGSLNPGPGLLSLPDAIALANVDHMASTITFDPTVFATPQTINLTGTQLELRDTSGLETITGPTAGVTIDAGGLSRVFQMDAGVSASFAGLTITAGNAADGGGVYNRGNLALTDCTVSSNSATAYGGGLYSAASSTLSLTNCTVSGNSAVKGGGLSDASTATMTLTNCTISGNSAGTAGGLLAYGATTLTNCTVSGNSASSQTGGLYSGLPDAIELVNTIVAGNTVAGAPSDVGGSFLSDGNNLIGATDGSSGWQVNDLTGTVASPLDPVLAPLGNYGGPTQTMALLPGSPAIDAGTAVDPATSANTPATDQRGLPRVGATDIGSVESQGYQVIFGGIQQSALLDTEFALPLGVVKITSNYAGDPVDGGIVTFTAPTSDASATLSASSATIAGGTASVTATANGIAGAYNVTASVSPASFSFSLQNVVADEAPSLVVDTTSDTVDPFDYVTSLREAIAYADSLSGAQTITFDPWLYAVTAGTITLTAGQLEISHQDTALTIEGPGADLLSVSGNNTSRVFAIENGAFATVSGLTIKEGDAGSESGGGFANFGSLTLTNCTVIGNFAADGGGVYSEGVLTLTDCSITGNTAVGTHTTYGFGGGLMNSGGTVVVTNSTFSGNVTEIGGAVASIDALQATLTNCTISGNAAAIGGGGLYASGQCQLMNCTVSGNYSYYYGGGLAAYAGEITLGNTIVAGNEAGLSGPDVYGPVASLGNNLIGVTECSCGWVASDLLGTYFAPIDPMLGPLADNGGPTQTMAVLAGSPAINAGTSVGAPSTDQRGHPRVDGVDIGAFESDFLSQPQTITFDTLADATYGDGDFALSATASSGLPVTYTALGEATVYQDPGSGTWFVHIVGAGYAVIVAHQAGDADYNVAPAVAQPLTIDQAALTVTANNDSKTYDGTAYSGGNGVTYAGFVNGDDPSALGGTLTYSGDSQGAVYAGSYTITPGGLTSSNYDITFVGGTLTINRVTLNVTGTSGDDTIDISLVAGPAVRVELNGSPYAADIPVNSLAGINVLGGAGNDVYTVAASIGAPISITAGAGDNALYTGATDLTFIGGAGDNDATITMADGAGSASLSPNTGTIAGPGYTISVSSTPCITVVANASVSADFYDSADNETFTALPNVATLMGPAYCNEVDYAGSVTAHASSGHDVTDLYDDSGSNTFTATPSVATFTGPGLSEKAIGFDSVTANAATGTTDTANLYDASGSNTFSATPASASFAGSGFSETANGFAKVYGFAASGTNDSANLSDTSGSNTLYQSPTGSSFTGTGFYDKVFGFKTVTAAAGSGTNDIAYLSDISGSNTFTATPTSATFTGSGFTNTANGFKQVYATAAVGTTDSASLSDASGNNTFTAKPTVSTFSGAGFLNQVSGFVSVTATAASGTNDTANLSDTSGTNTFTATQTSATFTQGSRSQTANGFKRVNATAAAGTTDSANLSDTSGSNTFTAKPTVSIFSGTGFFNQVTGFATVTATAASGTTDTANLYDASGTNTFTATPSSASFSGSGFSETANGFKTVYGYAANGTNDSANLSDTSGSNALYQSPTGSSFTGTGFYHKVLGFKSVTATAASGTNDVAYLSDISGSNTFTATPTSATFTGSGFANTANGFKKVYATAAVGTTDSASLSDTSGSNTFTANPTVATFSGAGFLNRVSGFASVTATAASGTSDTANLSDTSGTNTFTATQTSATFTQGLRSQTANGFKRVNATAAAGTTDTANLSDTSGSNTFTAKPTVSIFSGTGFFNQVTGFASVTATAASGTTDTANLYDASGTNTFTATPTSGTFSGTGLSETANGFKTVYGFAASGTNDSANLSDTSGSNTLYQSPTGSSFIGAGFYNKVLGFKSVTATAASGTNDIAYLSDISGSNTFTATPTSATFTGSGFANTANAFKKVYATAAAGTTDTANFSDSVAHPGNFTGTPTTSSLSGTGYLVSANNFVVVNATAATTTDVANLFDDALGALYTGAGQLGSLTGPSYTIAVAQYGTVNITGFPGAQNKLHLDTLDYVLNQFGDWTE